MSNIKPAFRVLFFFFYILFFIFFTSFSFVWSTPVATKTINPGPTPTSTAPCQPGNSLVSSAASVRVEQFVPETAVLASAVVEFDFCVWFSVVALLCRIRVGGRLVQENLAAAVVVVVETPSSHFSPVIFVRQQTPSIPSSTPPIRLPAIKKQKKMVVLNRATILRNAAIAEKYNFKK